MTALVLGALLAVAAPPALAAPPDSVAVDPGTPCPGGVVVTRAELEAAGAMHLHDALRLAGVLDAVSVDGFDAEPLGAALPFGERVRVLVDGAPVAGGAGIEAPGLDALPVVLGEIAHVVVCPGGFTAGAFGPSVDVQTAYPGRAFGAVGYGNETGDPGPLRYVPGRGAPNVDRWGPYAEGGAGLRAGPGAAWAAARYRTFLPTDPRISTRTSAATSRYPKRVGTVGALAATAPGLRARVGGRAFTDLAFAAPLAREVAFDHQSAQATALVGRGGLRGWVHAARLDLGPSSRDGLGVDPDWTESRLDAALAVGGAQAEAGVRVEHAAVDAPGVADGTATVGRAWARAQRGTPAAGGAAAVALAVSGDVGGGASVDAWWRGPVDIRVSASARREGAAEDRDLAFWRSRGYAGFGPPLPRPAGLRPAPLDVARLRLDVSGGRGGVRTWATARAVAASGSVALDRPGAAGTWGDAGGLALAGRAGASWAGRGVRARAWAEARGAVSGTAAFREAWRRVPRLRAVADVWARPDGRLALWGRLEARGGAVWAGFPEPDVPAAVVLDLGLSRRAWGDRLQASLGGRNVLGAEERTHPIGASLEARLFVRLEARL